MSDLISRQAAIDAVEFGITYAKAIDVNTGESKELFKEGNDALKKAVERLKELPSAESEIIQCKNCQYWNTGNCNCPDIRVDCSDYYVGDLVTEEDFYCGFAKRREGKE